MLSGAYSGNSFTTIRPSVVSHDGLAGPAVQRGQPRESGVAPDAADGPGRPEGRPR